ncbi:hypothetical protein C0992_010963 [Termitomyces sp. T32_za158]|nr:hypothetical protein C0992_010963 [Termitomyces sp. T32_za158]
MDKVNEGKNGYIITASDWPSFLYDLDLFNGDDQTKGLMRGPLLLKVYRHIFTGPSSALSGHRSATKPCIAHLHGLKEVTGRTIAYAAVQARFALSSVEKWTRKDGNFDSRYFSTDLICSHVEPASFFDGNLVLIVDEMVFQVHASVFVRQSPQFLKLWQTRSRHSNGVYTVRIYGEDPLDFAFMFMAIYRMDPTLVGRGPLPIDAIDSLLHYGDRFHIPDLYNPVADRVRAVFPRELATFDAANNFADDVLLTAAGYEMDLVMICKLFGLQTCIPVKFSKEWLAPTEPSRVSMRLI